MEPCTPFGARIDETGFGYTLSLISGKYKMVILYWLADRQVLRYNELKRYLGTVSHKTLSLSLKELKADGLVLRTEYPQIPPKVEYRLSPTGASLIPILDALCAWGETHRLFEIQGNGPPGSAPGAASAPMSVGKQPVSLSSGRSASQDPGTGG